MSLVRIERQIAELVVGRDGGWTLWLGALAGIEDAVRRLREDGESRFASSPELELRRLRGALAEATRRAEVAASIAGVIAAEEDGAATSVAALLHERAAERLERLRA